MICPDLTPYRDKLLLQSAPDGACIAMDADSGQTLRISWETAQMIISQYEKTGVVK